MIILSTQATSLKRMLQQLNRNNDNRAHCHNQMKTILMLLITHHHLPNQSQWEVINQLNDSLTWGAHLHVLTLHVCFPHELPISPAMPHGAPQCPTARTNREVGSHCVSETFRNFPSTPGDLKIRIKVRLKDFLHRLPMLGRSGGVVQPASI